MRILFTNGNEGHVSREVGEALILGGMATEVKESPQPPPKICRLIWQLRKSPSTDELLISYACDACGINGHGRGRTGIDALFVYHKGQRCTPPDELVAKVHELTQPEPRPRKMNADEKEMQDRYIHGAAYVPVAHGKQDMVSFQESGDRIRDLQTVILGHHPYDPQPKFPVK